MADVRLLGWEVNLQTLAVVTPDVHIESVNHRRFEK
jgi:hypothetical protein